VERNPAGRAGAGGGGGAGDLTATVITICALTAAIAVWVTVSVRRKHALMLRTLLERWGRPLEREPADDETLEDIAGYWRELARHVPTPNTVDDVTWNDLDLNDVFRALDYANSTPGEELLYAMLRNLGEPAATLERRQRSAGAMEAHADLRTQAVRILRRLGKHPYHSACVYLFNPAYKRPPRLPAYIALITLPLVFLVLGLFNAPYLLGFAGMFLVNTVVYYLSGKRWMSEITAVRHIASVVIAAGKLADALPPELNDMTEEMKALRRELKPVLRWNALFAMQRLNELDFLTDYIRISFQLDVICLNRLTDFFEKHHHALLRLYQLVGETDAMIAVAEYRAAERTGGLTVCEPQFTQGLSVVMEGLRHPLLKAPVPNDMVWDRCVLITGSNASGKSTFIKAVAVNAVLAQTLGLCTARRFAMPRAKVLTSMALRDSIRNNESYFIVEIKSLRRIVTALEPGTPTLCFIDEILRGTNTQERIAAASALLAYLQTRNCLCMAATHDYELVTLLAAFGQYHFQEEDPAGEMKFTYKLLEGPGNSRNAIALMERMAFPEPVVADARRTMQRLKAQRNRQGS